MTDLQRTQLQIAKNHFERSRRVRKSSHLRAHHALKVWEYLFRALEPQ